MNRDQAIGLLATHNVRTGVDTLEEVPSSRSRKVVSQGLPQQVQVGQVVGGRYEIVRFVAAGSFGAVYRANDLDVPGHVVALKLMHRPPASDMEQQLCRREVQLIAAVSHPSVVSFKDHGFHQGRFYIVMPWFEGETLAQRLRGEAALTRREALRIFQQLAQALAAMHARGIRHQDVKPENILLARFGEGQEDFPVLLDLGVGAFSHELVPGFTPAYVAPEMARAHLELMKGSAQVQVDGKADVFALALTLFDALAPGARDISECDGSPGALYFRAQEGVTLPSLKQLADIEPALRRFMAVDPSERPSASELVRELTVLTRAEDRRAEHRRMALRAGPFLSAVLAMSAALAMQLHNERAEGRVKDSQIEQQAAEIDRSRTALDELGATRETQLAAIQRAESENAELGDRVKAAHQKQQALKRALAEEQREVAEARTKLDGETARGVELAAELSSTREQVTRLSHERSALEQNVQRSEAARRELVASLDTLRQQNEKLEGAGARLASQNEALTAERERLTREREKLLSREAKLERELAALVEERDRLNAQNARLEKKSLLSQLNKDEPRSSRQLVVERLRERTVLGRKPIPVM